MSRALICDVGWGRPLWCCLQLRLGSLQHRCLAQHLCPESRDGYVGVSQKGCHHRAPRGSSAALQGLSLPAPRAGAEGDIGSQVRESRNWNMFHYMEGNSMGGRRRERYRCWDAPLVSPGVERVPASKGPQTWEQVHPYSLLDGPLILQIVHTSYNSL